MKKTANKKGLSEKLIRKISAMKEEPTWMLELRLKAYQKFLELPMPKFGPDLSDIDFDDFFYYLKPSDKPRRSWDEVPEDIKNTFEKLGIPQAERKYLAGVGAQFESELVYHNLIESLEKKGVLFESTELGLKKYPELFKRYFGSVVNYADNKLAALNTAIWSGGSFIYIPPGVHLELPLQAYFRINAEFMGQFERTLIIADKGSKVHYVEGCTAPTYDSNSLHSAVVEIICLEDSNVQYSTIQNWSNNVYNLVTKRAYCYANASMFWLDCNLGSRVTMKYPSVYLLEEGAKAEVLSIAMARKKQDQDAGTRIIHAASNTTSLINSKSISAEGGVSTFRGLVRVLKNAENVKASMKCDAVLLDGISKSSTQPLLDIQNDSAVIAHEASVSKISEKQLFYLRSKGFSESDAAAMIVNGFIDPVVKSLPMEYAVEMNRLVAMEMENNIG